MNYFLPIILVFFFTANAFSADINTITPDTLQDKFFAKQQSLLKKEHFTDFVLKFSENKKATAIILAFTLGPLGVHRLYLGTEWKVPVIYAITLGGGFGILPLTDIIAILLTKHLEKYQNNPRVIMWID
jgi:TM2 domain-containing membrane protein YozV